MESSYHHVSINKKYCAKIVTGTVIMFLNRSLTYILHTHPTLLNTIQFLSNPVSPKTHLLIRAERHIVCACVASYIHGCIGSANHDRFLKARDPWPLFYACAGAETVIQSLTLLARGRFSKSITKVC